MTTRIDILVPDALGPYYIVGIGGFVNTGPKAPDKFWTSNLRYAKNFLTWQEADDFGRANLSGWWSILKCAYQPLEMPDSGPKSCVHALFGAIKAKVIHNPAQH